MRTIGHISDLHFGTEDPTIAQELNRDLLLAKPDLLVVSGDLTQRARSGQFLAARKYLDQFPLPRLVVPGNHDIPLFNLFHRFLFPLAGYRKFISADLDPFYSDAEVAVLGISTPRRLTWKEGRISVHQMEEIRRKLGSLRDYVIKIVVTHHPFIPPPEDDGIRLVGRAARAMKILDECRVQLLLSGHLHHGYSGDVRPYYPRAESSILVVQAGTSISRRIRGYPNAYNIISIAFDRIRICVREWDGSNFKEGPAVSYIRDGEEWRRETPEQPP